MDPNIEKILKLPSNQKIALVAFIFIALGAGFFYGLFQPKMKELSVLQKKQDDLSRQIQENKRIADNLPKFKKDYEQLKVDLDNALTELPNQKEIPSLLTSITSKGKEAGLDFLVFKPKPEVPKDFYSEVPVEITILGSFYNVANFFVAVGTLPRIVNIANVNVADIRNTGGRMVMKVNCLATTFRFLEKKETKDEKKGK
ncbi:MAG TPA: type 4a pilus biogenesis protein PilO [Geobacteraceae bacterium]|nr:type 4a pilus biogenesis protein PilO [Geobacteraceae bacterium]